MIGFPLVKSSKLDNKIKGFEFCPLDVKVRVIGYWYYLYLTTSVWVIETLVNVYPAITIPFLIPKPLRKAWGLGIF